MNDTIIQLPDSLLPFHQWSSPHPMPTIDTCTGVPLDSIFRSWGADSIAMRASLISDHSLAPQHGALTMRTAETAPPWVFVAVVLLCFLIYLFYSNHKIRLGEILKSIFDTHGIERMLRNLSLRRTWYLIGVAFTLAATVALAIWNTAMQDTGLTGCLLLTLALSAAYLLRNGLLRLLGAVFDQQAVMDSYIGGNYLYHLLLATAITPMLFAVIYIPSIGMTALWVVAITAAIVFILRFARGVKLFLTNSKSPSLFLFYYLCTVEILPLLVLLKWFISQ